MQSAKKKELFLMLFFYSALIIGATIFWPGIHGPFLFDDFSNIQNLSLLSNGIGSESIGRYVAAYPGSPGRPISALSFLINDIGWPSDPYGFKYTNIFIHLLNTTLLFATLLLLSKTSNCLPKSPSWALLAALIWMVHPIQISAQMLTVQRMTLLSATFTILGVMSYVLSITKIRSPFDALLSSATIGFFTILAFLSKENGALLPLLIIVINNTLLKDKFQHLEPKQKIIISLSLIIPTTILVLSLLTYSLQEHAFDLRNYNLIERCYTQLHAVKDYLSLILIPTISGNGIYHDDYHIYRTFTESTTTIVLFFTFFSVLLWALFSNKFTIIRFSILWFFASHLMESTIAPLELYFEHRNYLPLISISMIISAVPYYQNGRLRKIIFSGLGFWILALCVITFQQSKVWGNKDLMALIWAAENPMSLRATQDLATYYYSHNKPQDGVNTLMDRYGKGLANVDLPLGALLTTCYVPSIKTKYSLKAEIDKTILTSTYTSTVLEAVKKMRIAMEGNVCNNLIDKKYWWSLTDDLLNNPYFKYNAQVYLRNERSLSKINENDLNSSVRELELAFDFNPSTELALRIAQLLTSAGLYSEAEAWIDRGLKLNQPVFDSLFYNPKKELLHLKSFIQHSQIH